MIYADPPRRYSRRGKKWSHVFSPDLGELLVYAKENGLRRKDRSPFIHFDVTEDELRALRGITIVERRDVRRLMGSQYQPVRDRAT